MRPSAKVGLIERLVLSPELKKWAVPVITGAIRQFGFDGSIEGSTLKAVNPLAVFARSGCFK